MSARVLREFADVVAKPFFIVFEKLCQSDHIPDDWNKGNVPIFKKCLKDHPGNYQPVDLTSVSSKIMGQILQEDILRHMDNREEISTASMASLKTNCA